MTFGHAVRRNLRYHMDEISPREARVRDDRTFYVYSTQICQLDLIFQLEKGNAAYMG